MSLLDLVQIYPSQFPQIIKLLVNVTEAILSSLLGTVKSAEGKIHKLFLICTTNLR